MWRVRSSNGQSAALELAEQPHDGDGAAGDGAATGPIVIPDPLGDKPLTLEILSEV